MSKERWIGALLFAAGLIGGAWLSSSTPHVDAQGRGLTIRGSCARGDVVVGGDSGELVCVAPGTLRFNSLPCDDGEFLRTDTWGALQCVGPSGFSSGARGLLPECSSGDTLVSEGFGRWRCQSPSR